jgi:hypothetical protein
MKTFVSMFALTLVLAFTVPAFAGGETRSNARRMAAPGMPRPSTVQENIEKYLHRSRFVQRTPSFREGFLFGRAVSYCLTLVVVAVVDTERKNRENCE